ncbi:hypothetical protein AB834_06890 [PVC group bacterium (ex Bugula neritina AB1)]|nr:hypothetical protein AB834_06890 [PVC group bacterium (ex Bugula neritina AB1)]
MSKKITLNFKIWRQSSPEDKGKFKEYQLEDVSVSMSFLETLDLLNEKLVAQNEEPVAFDHDCREGICGMCGAMVNGEAHGPLKDTTLCQLHMRHFKDQDTLVVEPWRSAGMPVVKDLVVDRSALDRIVSSGGYISAKTGSAPDANATLIDKEKADLAMDAASCIGCGACVAACPNASPMLFVGAKISQLSLLPQGQPESLQRVEDMLDQVDEENFGHCSNTYECEAACPKSISVSNIARANRQSILKSLKG